ncbi:MAG: Flp pilus assembly protein CpaB [Candidatus Omnitrophica bacterium]|nr:Flp pilus assembly protein CpaB [Candidatus Omnitrophota bacterium]
MNLEAKRQFAIIACAVGLGAVAAILTGNHIEGNIKKATAKLSQEYETKQIKPLQRDLETLRKEIKQLASRQVVIAGSGQDSQSQTPSVPKSSLALRTPAGKRAYTVMIDSLSAVGGLINPGDYVDVLAHMEIPIQHKTGKNTITSMVFQNAQILAVGTNLQAPGGYEKQQEARSLNITFALTPEEASLMSFIEKNGKMQLILRAPAETETEIMQAASWGALSEYVFEKQGTELLVPHTQMPLEAVTTGGDAPTTFIDIYRGGVRN